MASAKRILVVDDDVEIRELLQAYLAKAGYDVVTAQNGHEMQSKLAVQYPDLILLDVMLPGDDGFTLCKRIRKDSGVPIIMLTAVSDETDQIVGLELGADDYIAKPFSPRQLIARIRALLRRTQQLQETTLSRPKAIRFGQWRLEPATQQLHHVVTGMEIELSASDYALLMLFIDHPHQLLDRNAISQATRGRDAQAQERGIDVQVSRLRQRLRDTSKANLIKTVRGAGYMFVAEIQYES
ncbi:DNA-binding response regulator [Salinivibrio sp. MA351]|jgi:DNA-binding response OmpR family regulator|uniref:DNA-binding response regulator n=1 Tax=Salinivibrio costicola subsp. alcaliphilus TaxID=272773 RepID=A0ABX3KME1_SALCS|nr:MULTISPECIES: response regulator transcription factor [Salinivibrio]NUY55040.1 response regulator transcription factor [Salinivibrio sp. EAGSL]OOE92081.1 DNA-binding response regulator [Salinivibrio sp. AR647]OOE95532.1 DNA-binding response regulator [Salinivibrio sp. AR640]OOE98208.1 DNA-binding response regulator [Salinivibrio sp. IB643]OOE98410.1 DNA-binding response regulator [Salinivibrio sp. MA351]